MPSAPSASAAQGSEISRPSTNGPVVCVFCGSSPGTSPAHLAAARSLAHTFHAHRISLVYGGGTVGIMGEIARTLAALAGADAVHGIIPSALVAHERQQQQKRPAGTTATTFTTTDAEYSTDAAVYGRTTVVPDMHTRKQMMAARVMAGGPGSGFVALSGGYGTLEELMEVVTWNQLGIHGNAVVVYNVEGYWDGLLRWVRTAVSGGFIAPGNAGILVEALDAEEVVMQLREYKVSEDRMRLDWDQK